MQVSNKLNHIRAEIASLYRITLLPICYLRTLNTNIAKLMSYLSVYISVPSFPTSLKQSLTLSTTLDHEPFRSPQVYFSTSSISPSSSPTCSSTLTSPSNSLHLLTSSLTCASPLSLPKPLKLLSRLKRYSLFSPLGPQLSKIFFANAPGSCGPKNCGLLGNPM
jgi:hypothetical protein